MNNHPDPPIASTRSDLRNMRDHSQATVAELKAFLREMKGRSPQEMLGMVTGNPLARACGQAAIIIVLILAVFTAIPYFTRETPDTPPLKPVAESTPTATEAPGKEAPAEDKPEPDGALENLGIGEEKAAPSDVNPLDTNTGSFLDELE